MNIEIGKEYKTKFPFIITQYYENHEDGASLIDSWKPGTQFSEMTHEHDQPEAEAHGEGFMMLTVVDKHKPGRYTERTFYIRKWKDPDGKIFGADSLKMTTTSHFKTMIKGYRHPYRLDHE